MPLSGDLTAFRRFTREMQGGAKDGSPLNRTIMQAVKGAVQDRIKDQFRRGVGPDDQTQPPRKDGKPALVSSRLGNAARARVAGSAIYVEPKTAKVAGILDTQQEGHVFAGRQGRIFQYRDRKGKLISYRKFLRRITDTSAAKRVNRAGNLEIDYRRMSAKGRRRITATRIGVDKVKFGRRILRARHIRPVAGLPLPWALAIGRGFQTGMTSRIGKFAE